MYSPPPGQGHYQQQFDPPPTSAYEDHETPRDAYQEDRPYAPADPKAHPFNQMAPYDDPRVEEGHGYSWEEQHAYTYRIPPPPSDYELGRKPYPPVGGRVRDYRYDESYDDRHDNRHDDRYSDEHNGRYDNRYNDRFYDDSTSRVDRYGESQPRSPRRRSTEDRPRGKAVGHSKKRGRDFLGAGEGESGIAAKMIGGAGGALIGQTIGRGHTLETIAGAAVGAIAAKAIEKQIEKRKEDKAYVRRSPNGSVATSTDSYPQRGRDTADVRETSRDDKRPGLRERIRSLSRRGARSPSRRRPSEDKRRRSDSYDSMDSLRREYSR